jgi:hypothetical protein
MDGLADFFKDNVTGIITGGAIVGVAVYLMTPAQTQPRVSQPDTFQQRPPPAPEVDRRPPRRPWYPGAPRNPQECIARGGIDLGTGCRGFHR